MRRRNEVMVGMAVILGIALIIFGTIWMQGRRLGQQPRTLIARFDEAGQILKGNSVKLRGVLIGRVEKIELEPSGAGVLVSMSVDPEVRLPEDPVVILAPESMFGDWQAQIFPRSAFQQYEYSESPDPNVLPGFTLPDLSRLTAVADEIAGNLRQLERPLRDGLHGRDRAQRARCHSEYRGSQRTTDRTDPAPAEKRG